MEKWQTFFKNALILEVHIFKLFASIREIVIPIFVLFTILMTYAIIANPYSAYMVFGWLIHIVSFGQISLAGWFGNDGYGMGLTLYYIIRHILDGKPLVGELVGGGYGFSVLLVSFFGLIIVPILKLLMISYIIKDNYAVKIYEDIKEQARKGKFDFKGVDKHIVVSNIENHINQHYSHIKWIVDKTTKRWIINKVADNISKDFIAETT